MEERNSQYKIEQSRNGLNVPVINGIYLHSIYDPKKEAQTFAEKYRESLKHKNNILVLGLGYGYHIEEIAKILAEYHADFSIIVLETNANLIEDFEANQKFNNDKSHIVELQCAKQLYDQLNFVNFLMQKPCVIKHEASFSLDSELYSSVLTYKASDQIKNYQELLSPASKKIISTDVESSFKDYAAFITQQNKVKSNSEHLTLALNAIINK